MTATAAPSQAAEYGRQFASFYDRLFPGGAAAEQTAEALAAWRADDGSPALELGVGTGRVALPLAARSGPVVGVDGSPDMLARLREALGGRRDVEPVQADIREYEAGRPHALVYCVCATISMVLEPGGARRVLERAAAARAPHGVVVVETHDPAGVEALHDGRARETFFTPYPGPDTGLLSHSQLDAAAGLWQLSHVWFEDGRARVATETSRLLAPDALDADARAAGLRPVERWGDWAGGAHTGAGPTYVAVYR